MKDSISDIIEKIDQHMNTKFTGKFFGLCELVQGQAETYPVTAVPHKRKRISPKDTYALQVYTRSLGASLALGDEFGRDRVFSQRIRVIVIADSNMGEGFIYRYVTGLPRQVRTAEGFAVIENDVTINTDQQNIVSTEFGEMPADKHQLVKNIWALEFSLHITLSDRCLPTIRLTKCNWILEVGRWDDSGCWDDLEFWKDN